MNWVNDCIIILNVCDDNIYYFMCNVLVNKLSILFIGWVLYVNLVCYI